MIEPGNVLFAWKEIYILTLKQTVIWGYVNRNTYRFVSVDSCEAEQARDEC